MALLCEFTLFNGTACQVPDSFCASTYTYTRNKVTINMALTFMISYVMLHLAKSIIQLFGIWYSYCKFYMPDMLQLLNQTTYRLM